MHRAGQRLREHGDVGREVVGGVHLVGRADQRLGEPARSVDPEREEVLAEEVVAARALGAAPAGRGVVDRDPLPGDDVGDIRADLADGPGRLVAGRQREGREEAALVQVQVGAAHPGEVDVDDDLARPRARPLDLPDGERPGLVVDDRAHRRGGGGGGGVVGHGSFLAHPGGGDSALRAGLDSAGVDGPS